MPCAGPLVARQRLAAELLEQVEQRALDRVLGLERAVQRRVRPRQPQRQAVRGAAEGIQVIKLVRRVEVRRVQRQPLPPPVQPPAPEVQVPLPRQRADGGSAELVQALLAPDLGRQRHAPGPDGASSASKQRW